MNRLLAPFTRQLRRSSGLVLQAVARRLLAVPTSVDALEGDQLSLVATTYGCERETDDELRERVRRSIERSN